jgi:hypothetical protein
VSVGRYRIKSPTIALSLQDGRHVARTLPAGAIITAECVDGNELVEITWDRDKFLMFAQDIRSRGEEIDKISN